MRYELVEKDADRHPSDVPVVAVQVSLRDIVIMAFMAGMECTAANFEYRCNGTVGLLLHHSTPF